MDYPFFPPTMFLKKSKSLLCSNAWTSFTRQHDLSLHWALNAFLRVQKRLPCVSKTCSPPPSSLDRVHFKLLWKVKKTLFLGLAMLCNLHIPEARFNLVSTWLTLRDCLCLPLCSASLALIIPYKQCIICVSSKQRPLQSPPVVISYSGLRQGLQTSCRGNVSQEKKKYEPINYSNNMVSLDLAPEKNDVTTPDRVFDSAGCCSPPRRPACSI